MSATAQPGQPTTPDRTPFPILRTKLFVPPARSDTVLRPRLIDRLNAGLSGKLTLISAPAGFGKTTMVVDWHRSEQGRRWKLGWVSLDEGDNDLARFLTYLIYAFKAAAPEVDDNALEMLQNAQQPPAHVPITMLINDLGRVTDPAVIVLDDYHVIEDEAIHEAMAFLVDHLPPNARLILTARSDPPLPLSLLRARRELAEIGADELRFTSDEAAAFLNDVMGLGLTPRQIEELEERTEGWIAGLLLAALSAEDASDREALISSFSGEHHFVFDYLAEEVLSRQPEDINLFLMWTSVLEQMSAGIANAVTGRSDSQEILEQLERANLFIVPLDQNRGWYRYHHLFADFLKSRLQREDPDGWREAHERAIEWYEGIGYLHQATHHALEIEDYERAGALIARTGANTIKAGRSKTITRWLSALPESVVNSSADLLLLCAWGEMTHRRFSTTEKLFERIEERRAELTPAQAEQFNVMRMSLAFMQGDPARAIEIAEADPLSDESDSFNLSMYYANLGGAYRMLDELPQAVELLTLGAELSLAAGNIPGWLIAHSQRAIAWMTLGDLTLAAASYREAIEYEESQGLSNLGFAIASHLGLGEILREWNELDEAEEVLERALNVLRDLNEAREIGTYLYGLIILARLRYAQGRYEDSISVMDEALTAATNAGVSGWQYERVEATRARALIALGRLDEASAWAESRGYTPDDDFDYFHEMVYQTVIRILSAQGRHDDAEKVIGTGRALATRGDRRRRLIELDVLDAVVQIHQGQLEDGMERLESAMTSAERDNYIRVFADEGPVVGNLLAELQRRGRAGSSYSADYLTALIKATGTDIGAAGAAVDQSGLVEPLSEREIEVLELLAEGLTNKEVADRLYVSVGTIKRHTHNIYGKLGAHNRTQAALRGRELGLID